MADRLAELARHLQPDLAPVADAVSANADAVIASAFPGDEPGFNSRAIVGAKVDLPGDELDAKAQQLEEKRKSLVRRGVELIDGLFGRGGDPPLAGEDRAALESLIAVARPALYVHAGNFRAPPPPWRDRLDPHRTLIAQNCTSIGRIVVDGLPSGLPYAGTGFAVGRGIVMTNCHVAKAFAAAAGEGAWTFQSTPALDTLDDPDDGRDQAPWSVERVIGIHPQVDLALLGLAGDGPKQLRIASDPLPDGPRALVVIGYPARGTPVDGTIQASIFGDRYGVKRLQPGGLMAAPPGADFTNWTDCSARTTAGQVLFHDASTLGGNSGSAVFDLATNQVIGLHFGGKYMDFNVAVELRRLADDPLLTGLNWN